MIAFPPPRTDPTVSVVVRTRNEADRLRLTLVSLACQTHPVEVVVVDDGSDDHTPEVIAAASGLRIRAIRHECARGRSAASNAGAAAAKGAIVLFLDGDTLAGPTLGEDHIAAHRQASDLIARGETWNLRCTRCFLDPDSGRPQPGQADRVAALGIAERDALRVSREQIRGDFHAILRRAQPGTYPGHGPKRLHALEMDALRHHPDCTVLWAAASGSNLSVDRKAFIDAGGFDERLDLNEHRELALRLCLRRGRMVPVERARTFHMTHRSGWRDPLKQRDWLETMMATHQLEAVRLLPIFWAGLTDTGVPEIASLPDLERYAAAANTSSTLDGCMR